MAVAIDTQTSARQLGVGEFHAFEASGQRFAYLVPSAAVFAFDDCSSAVVDLLKSKTSAPDEILAALPKGPYLPR